MSDIGKYSAEFLQPFRKLKDLIADKVIDKILAHENVGVLKVLFETLAKNDMTSETSYDIFSEAIRDDVKEYFENSGEIPIWADRSEFEKATSLFQMYGPEILTILISYSLPICYSCANGAKVLYQTGRLQTHDGSLESFTRRIVETAQFVINVLSPRALLGDRKEGVVTVQKIRLIHATIRYHILNKDQGFDQAPDFDAEVYGQPINQEDLAGTMLSFSVIILRGLEKYGIEVSQEHKEAFVHYWNVIGSMLGVQKELIPENHSQAEQLMNGIFEHESAYSKEGEELTMACISFMEHHVSIKKFEHVPLALVHFFCEDEGIPKLLKLPDSDDHLKLIGSRFFKQMEKRKSKREHRVLIRYVASLFSRKLIEGFLRIFNEGKKIQFHVPSSLSEYGTSIEYRKKLPVGAEITSIDVAIRGLQDITNYFKATNDPMGLFSAIYLLSTRMVKAGLDNNEFETPDLMEKVDLAFVNRYFTAINHYLAGTQPTSPWEVAIKCCKRDDMFVNQYIFNGANAHIVFDLGIAVGHAIPGKEVDKFEKDFNTMNDVFATMYYQMNLDIAAIWGPFARIMKWADDAILKFENKIMEMSREGAWERARTIAMAKAGPEQDKVIEEYAKKAVDIGEKIIYPGFIKSLIFKRMANKEVGSVADKIDIMLRTDHLEKIN